MGGQDAGGACDGYRGRIANGLRYTWMFLDDLESLQNQMAFIQLQWSRLIV